MAEGGEEEKWHQITVQLSARRGHEYFCSLMTQNQHLTVPILIDSVHSVRSDLIEAEGYG